MKLNTSVRSTKEAVKILKISTKGLEVGAKEQNCTTPDAKDIISLLWACYKYMQILIFLTALNNKPQYQLALGKYLERLMMLKWMYTWDSVWEYYFDFHQAWILKSIGDSVDSKKSDNKLKQYPLVTRNDRNTNSNDNRNAYVGNLSLPSVKLCFKYISEKDCPSNCRFLHQNNNCAPNHTNCSCFSQSITWDLNNVNSTSVNWR